MKILLVGNHAPDGQESMQRFAALLESELLGRGHEVRLLCPPIKVNRWKRLPASRAKWLGYIDKFLLFPRVLKRAARWADVVHICDHSNAFYTHFLQGVPHLVTCHDVLAIQSARGQFPQNLTGRSGQILQNIILNGLKRAQRVVCDSEATQYPLEAVSGLDAWRTELIYIALNYSYSPMPRDEARQLIHRLLEDQGINRSAAETFVLHVGGNTWYKNRLGVLQIFHALRQQWQTNEPAPHLVLAGAPLTLEMQTYIAKNGLTPCVHSVVGCSNEELRALYCAASLLVFPSLAEGFGWPIIEAQSCGCPVFTSNRAPMTEVGGDAAVYLDPTQPAQAAQVIAQHWDETAAMTRRGLENVQRFTIERMLTQYIAAYQRVLNDHPHPQSAPTL